jgi:hypothetical protein
VVRDYNIMIMNTFSLLLVKVQRSKGCRIMGNYSPFMNISPNNFIHITSNIMPDCIFFVAKHKYIVCRIHSSVSPQSNSLYSVTLSTIERRKGLSGTQLIWMYRPQSTPKQSYIMEGHNVEEKRTHPTSFSACLQYCKKILTIRRSPWPRSFHILYLHGMTLMGWFIMLCTSIYWWLETVNTIAHISLLMKTMLCILWTEPLTVNLWIHRWHLDWKFRKRWSKICKSGTKARKRSDVL